MSIILTCIIILLVVHKAMSDLQCPEGSVKYPIIWGSDFDDKTYSKLPSSFLYETTYIDAAILTDELYMGVRFHHLRTQTLSDKTVVPDYTYDNITVPILMKTSPITGKIIWSKNFFLRAEPNGESAKINFIDSVYDVFAILEIQNIDSLWIRVDKLYRTSFSRFLKVDTVTGTVLASIQLSQGSIGINLKANKMYFASNNELLLSSDGNKTYNIVGVSESSQIDPILIKVEVDTNKVIMNSVCDSQNGNEYSSNIEVDNDIVYQLGQK